MKWVRELVTHTQPLSIAKNTWQMVVNRHRFHNQCGFEYMFYNLF